MPVLRAVPVIGGKPVVIDGNTADGVWSAAKWLEVDVGGRTGKVKLKAAYDAESLYLLALWNDADASFNRYWKRTGVTEFEKYEREDGFGVVWSPGGYAEQFREQGCALFCHGDVHARPDESRGMIDFWYWGSQQTNRFPQARDMALRDGADRLRGDAQPDRSDNLLNTSTEFTGPRYFPFKVGRDFNPFLVPSNLREVKRITLEQKIPTVRGRKVPIDIQRARRGSRGDVRAAGRHYRNQGWVLELARKLETGHADDQPLTVDPLVGILFAVAVYDDGPSGGHARSGPIELRFVTQP